MYEKSMVLFIVGFILLLLIWYLCGRDLNRRAGAGTGPDVDRTAAGIGGAAEDNQQLREAEQRTHDAIERAEAAVREQAGDIKRAKGNAERSQQLVQKARDILHSAKHTDGNN